MAEKKKRKKIEMTEVFVDRSIDPSQILKKITQDWSVFEENMLITDGQWNNES